MNVKGLQRPLSAQKNTYHYSPIAVNVDSYPKTAFPSAVSYSGAAANQRYLDMEDNSIQVVCGGTPKLFTWGLGILKDDTQDGELGSYVGYGLFYVAVKDSDTPAANAFLYWDDTNKYLTTTSGGNSKVAVSMTGYADWKTGSTTSPSQQSLCVVSGRKWALVELRPMI